MSKTIKGYKVFNSDWTCRGKKYECPGRFKEDVDLGLCNAGMHFCESAADCFDYYDFSPENKVAEVIARGRVETDGKKSCTDDLEIVREIPWEEVLRTVNTGKGCSGNRNSGNRNSGDWNSGDWNSGNRNSGDWNSGDWNSGDWNSGDWNSGDWNSGDWNSGDWNSGDWNSGDWNSGNRNSGDWNSGNRNSGDWNSGDWNSGCFNTKSGTIRLFNKASDWAHSDWTHSYARKLLNQIPQDVVEWVYSSDMTDSEKKEHPEHETTGGYLKILDESECGQIWWDGLNEDDRKEIRSIPNYDREIFEEITGINTGDGNG